MGLTPRLTKNPLYSKPSMAQRFKPGKLIQSTIDSIRAEKSDSQLWKDFRVAKADDIENLYQDYLTNQAYKRLRGSGLVLSQSVLELPIPSHARNILKKNGIDTVEDLIKHSSRELFHLSGFGQKSLDIIEDYLSRVGFELANTPHKNQK